MYTSAGRVCLGFLLYFAWVIISTKHCWVKIAGVYELNPWMIPFFYCPATLLPTLPPENPPCQSHRKSCHRESSKEVLWITTKIRALLTQLFWHAATWRNPKEIIMSEKEPIPKDYILYDSIHIAFLNVKILEMENRLLVSRS